MLTLTLKCNSGIYTTCHASFFPLNIGPAKTGPVALAWSNQSLSLLTNNIDINSFLSVTDINECEVDTDVCEDGCQNTIGSFFCTCPSFGNGFKANGTACIGKLYRFVIKNVDILSDAIIKLCMINVVDIDECIEGGHDCSSINKRMCINNNGSFQCVCIVGYHEDNHTRECIGM